MLRNFVVVGIIVYFFFVFKWKITYLFFRTIIDISGRQDQGPTTISASVLFAYTVCATHSSKSYEYWRKYCDDQDNDIAEKKPQPKTCVLKCRRARSYIFFVNHIHFHAFSSLCVVTERVHRSLTFLIIYIVQSLVGNDTSLNKSQYNIHLCTVTKGNGVHGSVFARARFPFIK